MNLIEFISHGRPVFVNVAHVVTARPAHDTGGAAAPGNTIVALANGGTVEIDGEAREVSARLGTIFYS